MTIRNTERPGDPIADASAECDAWGDPFVDFHEWSGDADDRAFEGLDCQHRSPAPRTGLSVESRAPMSDLEG